MAKLSRATRSPSRNNSGEDLKRLEPAADSFHVNGGDGNYSYFRNSYQQRVAAEGVKEKIEDEILTKFDVEKLCSTSNTICLADLGCAVGPNTFTAMQDVIKVMNNKYQFQRPESKMPEFQVFFNDQASNDFNTFFKCLPKEREYLAAVVAGSFHGRLFPKSSIHFAHSSYAMHWLSQVPEELLDKQSAAWNKGRVHYTNAPDEVVSAYASQFGKDMEKFLDARAQEIVVGGMMTIIMPGIPDGMRYSELTNSVMYETMASIFMDMASEGLINEDEVDSFNLPIYAASPAEMAALVEKNGHFSIEILELTNPAPQLDGPIDIPPWVMHVRAAMEEMFTTHFEDEIIKEMFDRLTNKLLELSDEVESRFWKRTQLFLVLMRK